MKRQIFSILLIGVLVIGTASPSQAQTQSARRGRIVFVSGQNSAPGIYVIDPSVNTPRVRRVTAPPEGATQLSSPVFSPDGLRLAFVAADASEQASQIHIINLDGSDEVELARNSIDPAWSPDGKQLLFSHSNADILDYQLGILPASGRGTMKQLTEESSGEFNGKVAPAWSPDGKRIAFTWTSGMQWHISVMNADGTAIQLIPKDSQFGGRPRWSPDSGKIAYAAWNAEGIYVMNADGSNIVSLTNGKPMSGGSVVWSGDGSRLVFSTDEPKIYVVQPDGSGLKELTTGFAPAWSPDNTQIAFVATEGGDGIGNGDVYVINVDGSGRRRLTTGMAVSDLAWWG